MNPHFNIPWNRQWRHGSRMVQRELRSLLFQSSLPFVLLPSVFQGNEGSLLKDLPIICMPFLSQILSFLFPLALTPWHRVLVNGWRTEVTSLPLGQFFLSPSSSQILLSCFINLVAGRKASNLTSNAVGRAFKSQLLMYVATVITSLEPDTVNN